MKRGGLNKPLVMNRSRLEMDWIGMQSAQRGGGASVSAPSWPGVWGGGCYPGVQNRLKVYPLLTVVPQNLSCKSPC